MPAYDIRAVSLAANGRSPVAGRMKRYAVISFAVAYATYNRNSTGMKGNRFRQGLRVGRIVMCTNRTIIAVRSLINMIARLLRRQHGACFRSNSVLVPPAYRCGDKQVYEQQQCRTDTLVWICPFQLKVAIELQIYAFPVNRAFTRVYFNNLQVISGV